MVDIAPTLAEWIDSGQSLAIATVIDTWGSSPRPVGSFMAVNQDGRVLGSVSGGCVEAAVIEACQRCIQDKIPRVLEFSGLPDKAFWEVGLSCGGTIRILIQPSFPLLGEILCKLMAGEGFALIHRWNDGSTNHELVALDTREVSESDTFVQRFPRPNRLLVFGSVHIAIPLISMSKTLGFQTILVEPRASLATATAFIIPPDRILEIWPEQAITELDPGPDDFAVILTHDPKIDDVAVAELLRTNIGYIGALGSTSTQLRRANHLRELGFGDHDLGRIHGPIGLSIGATSPAEIAVSILAEIVQVRNAGK